MTAVFIRKPGVQTPSRIRRYKRGRRPIRFALSLGPFETKVDFQINTWCTRLRRWPWITCRVLGQANNCSLFAPDKLNASVSWKAFREGRRHCFHWWQSETNLCLIPFLKHAAHVCLGYVQATALRCLTVVTSQITAFRTSFFYFLLSYLFILHRRLKRTIFTLTKHNMRFFVVTRFIKLQNNTYTTAKR